MSDHVGRVLTGHPQAGPTAARGALPAVIMRETPEAAGPVVSAIGEAPIWSVWAGPNVTWGDQDDPVAGNEGHILTHGGLDRRS